MRLKGIVTILMLIAFSYGLSWPSYSHYAADNYSLPIFVGDKDNSLDYFILGEIIDKKILIVQDIDLKGNELKLPEGYLLVFKGGVIHNGTLVGNQNKISCKGVAFDNVRICGEWNVPTISTSLFSNLSEVNSLKNVFALSNPLIHNKIIIRKGEYYVSAQSNGECCLSICSNTDLILDGSILLLPNGLVSYDVIRASGDNISIKGHGVIVGDYLNHKGQIGEWGMGIHIQRANNVRVQGLTIKNCWGDCLYIGDKSRNVVITKCKIIHGRRQGISITSAEDVTITNCFISEVYGTSPEYAIDAEPNEGDTVNNVVIDKVRILNCEGGVLAYGHAKQSRLGSIKVCNSNISTNSKAAIGVIGGENVILKHNQLKNVSEKGIVICRELQKATIEDNAFLCTRDNNDISHLLITTDCLSAYARKNKVKIQ